MKLKRILSLVLTGLLLWVAGTQADAMEAYPSVTTISIPGSDMKLVLPNDMKALEDRYDEYTDQEMVVYLITPLQNDSTVLMTLTTIRKEAYQGKTLDDLQDQELYEELAGRTHGVGELDVYWLYSETGVPMILIHESLDTEAFSGYRMVANNFYFLFAMKDGWLTYIEVMDAQGLGPADRLLTTQMRFMESMLAGSGAAPSLETETIRFPTQSGAIALDVPYGYLVEASETGVTLVDMQAFYKKYHIATISLGDEQDITLDGLRVYFEPLVSYEGETVSMEIMEESSLGVPLAMLHTESITYYLIYGIIDGYVVNIILTTEGAAEVTQEDIDVFSEWLRVV